MVVILKTVLQKSVAFESQALQHFVIIGGDCYDILIPVINNEAHDRKAYYPTLSVVDRWLFVFSFSRSYFK